MQRWHIQSGNLKGEVEAKDHEQAFLALLESQGANSLGKIYQVYKMTADGKRAYGTTVYASTEATLRRAGLWASDEANLKRSAERAASVGGGS